MGIYSGKMTFDLRGAGWAALFRSNSSLIINNACIRVRLKRHIFMDSELYLMKVTPIVLHHTLLSSESDVSNRKHGRGAIRVPSLATRYWHSRKDAIRSGGYYLISRTSNARRCSLNQEGLTVIDSRWVGNLRRR